MPIFLASRRAWDIRSLQARTRRCDGRRALYQAGRVCGVQRQARGFCDDLKEVLLTVERSYDDDPLISGLVQGPAVVGDAAVIEQPHPGQVASTRGASGVGDVDQSSVAGWIAS